MSHFPLLRRAVSSTVALAVVLTCPGAPAYAAGVEVIRLDAVAAPQGPRGMAAPFAGNNTTLVMPSLSVPSLSSNFFPSAAPAAMGIAAAPAAAAGLTPAFAAPAPANVPAAAAPAVFAAPSAAPALAAPPAAADAAHAPAPFRAASREISAALEAVGDLTKAAPAGLRGLGERLEAALR